MTELSPVVAVVVSYNTRKLLSECLNSVIDQLGTNDRIVVVDNSSHDGSADMVEEHFPKVHLVRSDKNLGFGAGCNLGAALFPDHDVLLFNPDALAYPGMVAALRSATSAGVGGGLVGGRAVDENGATDPRSCWGSPTPWSAFCFASGLSTVFAGKSFFDPESIAGWDRTTRREVDIISGALMMIERRLWNRLGGFDVRYFMYGEDLDLCLRARQLGARPTLIPEAVMRHDGGASSTGATKRNLVLQGKITAALDNHGGLSGRFMQGCYVGGTAIRAALAVLTRRSSPWRAVWPERGQWSSGYRRHPPELDI